MMTSKITRFIKYAIYYSIQNGAAFQILTEGMTQLTFARFANKNKKPVGNFRL